MLHQIARTTPPPTPARRTPAPSGDTLRALAEVHLEIEETIEAMARDPSRWYPGEARRRVEAAHAIAHRAAVRSIVEGMGR